MTSIEALPKMGDEQFPLWVGLVGGTHDIQDGEWVVWPRVRYFHVPTQTYHPSHDVMPLVPYDDWMRE